METKAITNLSRISNENFYCGVYYAPKQMSFKYCASIEYKPIKLPAEFEQCLHDNLKEVLAAYKDVSAEQFTFIINIKKFDAIDNLECFRSLVATPICENIIIALTNKNAENEDN